MQGAFSKTRVLILTTIIIVIGFAVYENAKDREQRACTEEAKLCSDGSYVGRTSPSCAFTLCPKENLIQVDTPHANEKIGSPLTITGSARGTWFFEAIFPVKLLDANGNLLAETFAQAESEWMTEDFVPFKSVVQFSPPRTQEGTLILEKDNPSGLPEHADELRIPVTFGEVNKVEMKKVQLFFYNPEKDKDETGNIMCSRTGLVAVEREIPISKTPIKDTINLLLKGKQVLKQEDLAQGITTEYPLERFSLSETNLKPDGTLIIKFSDPLNKTTGGSCRVSILWSQIEATTRQYPEVKKVQFQPEELFQP